MKPLTILLLLLTVGCASKRPPIWKDQYGIIHKEDVQVNEVSYVKIVWHYDQIPGGCIRLHNIYMDGTVGVDWDLKIEAAKMHGTHVVKEYYGAGLNNTMGIAFDCRNHAERSKAMRAHKTTMRNLLMAEKNRRTYEKAPGKIKTKKSSIPVLEYKPYN